MFLQYMMRNICRLFKNDLPAREGIIEDAGAMKKSIDFEPVYHVRLSFQVLKTISNVQFYQGIYWSALIRCWLNAYHSIDSLVFASLKIDPITANWLYLFAHNTYQLEDYKLHPIPCQNGLIQCLPGDVLCLDILVSKGSFHILKRLIRDWWEARSTKDSQSHSSEFEVFANHESGPVKFSVPNTLELTDFICLVSRESDFSLMKPIDYQMIYEETKKLTQSENLEFHFHTPLRQTRAKNKQEGHEFLDQYYFHLGDILLALASSLKWDVTLKQDDYDDKMLKTHCFIWVDMPYGDTTFGGIMGGAISENKFSFDALLLLVAGQYICIGRNTAFGFGHYRIVESQNTFCIGLMINSTTLLGKASQTEHLKNALSKMKNSSPGPDNLTTRDLHFESKAYINSVHDSLINLTYSFGKTRRVAFRTKANSYRVLNLPNIRDRHICHAINDVLGYSFDSLLSKDNYAYRHGTDYHVAAKQVLMKFKSGFEEGLQTDIEAFFDSIDPIKIRLLLHGLLHIDPILFLINGVLKQNSVGIAQGNPLSPLLSNLYLTPFDREIRRHKNFSLIRYGDDICIFRLSKKAQLISDLKIESLLLNQDLKQSPHKTQSFNVDQIIEFCGYRIGKQTFEVLPREQASSSVDSFIPIFSDNLPLTKPVYVTSLDTYVKHDGEELVIVGRNNSKRIPWHEIQRIVVIGKPRISPGAGKQAIYRDIPVNYLSLLGNHIGGFNQFFKYHEPQSVYCSDNCSWDTFRLSFIRNIAMSKIHNQRVFLKEKNIDEDRLKEIEHSIKNCTDENVIRGKEGAASAIYWKLYSTLVEPFTFERRSYYPPEGEVNAMLSLGYSLLYIRIAEALIHAQLSPFSGLFHEPGGKHFALASDLIESFRFLVDRLVIALIRNKQIQPDSFETKSSWGHEVHRLTPYGMKTYIHKFEMTQQTITQYKGTSQFWAELIDSSAQKLMRCLRLGIEFNPYRME
jgi:CRISPR-associated endonuclease Cas1